MPDQVEPEKILRTLAAHEVEYVVIGSMAAILQGVPVPRTLDLDVAAARTRSNLRSLARALKELGAVLRVGVADEPVPATLDERFLANVYILTTLTTSGPFDVLFDVPGAGSFEDLRARAVRLHRFDLDVPVASLEDIVASKRAVGREKDAAHLAVLLEFMRRGKV